MYTEEFIKNKIKDLYQTNPNIHISVSLAKPHIELDNVCVKIVGVYSHIFQVEENKSGKIIRHSVQYGDVSVGIAKIKELSI